MLAELEQTSKQSHAPRGEAPSAAVYDIDEQTIPYHRAGLLSIALLSIPISPWASQLLGQGGVMNPLKFDRGGREEVAISPRIGVLNENVCETLKNRHKRKQIEKRSAKRKKGRKVLEGAKM